MRSILRSPWLRAAAFAVLSCVLCLSASASTVPTAAEPAAAGSGETQKTNANPYNPRLPFVQRGAFGAHYSQNVHTYRVN